MSPMRQINANLRFLAFMAQRKHVVEAMAIVLSIGSMIRGVLMVLFENEFIGPNFKVARQWAPIHTWGWAFVVAGFMLMVAVFWDRKAAHYPAVGLTLIHVVLGLCSLAGTRDGAVPTGASVNRVRLS